MFFLYYLQNVKSSVICHFCHFYILATSFEIFYSINAVRIDFSIKLKKGIDDKDDDEDDKDVLSKPH